MGTLQDAMMANKKQIEQMTGTRIQEPKKQNAINHDVDKKNVTVEKLRTAQSIREFKVLARTLLLEKKVDINDLITLARGNFGHVQGFEKLNASLLELRSAIDKGGTNCDQKIRRALRRSKSNAWK